MSFDRRTLLGSSAAPVAAAAPQGVALELPRPTGPLAVGRDSLHLVDRSRKDPWVPTADRELMLSLFYPARPRTGTPSSYMTVPEATTLLAQWPGVGDRVTPEQVAATRTYAREDARPQAGRYPLVVLSPGFTVPRTTLTALAEDLASRGYVVAAVDHAYESAGTSFPGDRLLSCLACEQVRPTQDYRRVSDGRAKDIAFVLDRLTGPGAVWRHSRLIDPRHIGMAGHSIGGASAASTMAADRRVDAGVNMDGTFFTPVPESGLNGRPFMMLGGDPALWPPGSEEPSWSTAWTRLDGWKRWLTVTGTGHFAFTDTPYLGDQLGMTDPDSPLSGTRSVQITRAYVGAFFAQHLKHSPQPLLTGPSPAHPEVVFRQQ
ncbi:alpha/beta hydrolase [Streptomyces sp. WAC06614]|uniref:alpha/beta hydrolase family protein n=1 Tax=Streptomyces sp. WAC06614 TaxID=2487416 RepID=UPI000F7A8408|nr:alpha/beta hydrolase [Streptomyces sp. WAC06614]RSS70744.1 alpha/beta hydrolase [Streptomyces sp. WAC06614]